MGIPGARVFSGLSEHEITQLYHDPGRLNENGQNPTTREQTIPQNSPNKQPGSTDNTNPSAPKQQNRADEIGRNLRVLASQFPVLSGSIGERRMP